MSEQFKLQSQERNSEDISKQERFQKLGFLFIRAENAFAKEGREAAKPLLLEIYDELIALNKRDKKDWQNIWIWNPDGDLTEEEFNDLNIRRKKLSNDVAIMTASGEVRPVYNTEMENHKNYIEQGNERIPTKEEILGIIGRHAEKYKLKQYLYDENGPYLIEAEGEKAGEIVEYQYIRKRKFPSGYISPGTTINVLYFDEEGTPCTTNTIAIYNHQTGEWQDIE